jgi:hypothetical protein
MQKLLDRAGWIVASVLAVSLLALAADIARGGPLDPSSPPGSTLPQVEPRVPIPPVGWNGTFPISINQPGSYYLTRNLTGVSGQHGITINTEGVTLDLNGFELRGVANSLDGISIPMLRGDIVIKNGTIRGWGDDGIDAPATVRSFFRDLTISLNAGDGIVVGQGSVVQRVISNENGFHGIEVAALNFYRGGLIVDSRFANNDKHGINLVASYTEVRNCTVAGNGFSGGWNAVNVIGSHNDVSGNVVRANAANGIVLFGDYNTVSANTSVANGGDGIVANGGDFNTIIGNTAVGNGSDGVDDAGTGNRIGPLVGDAALTSSNPFANVAFNNPPP